MFSNVLKFRLQRFVALTPMKSGLQAAGIAFTVGDVNISVGPIAGNPSLKLLMVAETFFDAESINGFDDVNVARARTKAESAISEAVPILSTIVGGGFRVESCSPFFFVDWPENSNGSARLSGDWVIAKVLMSPEINITRMSVKDAIELLGDRSTGTKLLAQGLSTGHSIGRFLSFCQLFENAFGAQLDKLGPDLAIFLEGSHFGYGPDEVQSWIKIRGSAAHGDLKRAKMIANEHQVSRFIDRMQQAAYDVLMNKKNWHKVDVLRRNKWSPTTALNSESGDLAFVLGVPPKVILNLFDPFTNWPIAKDCKVECSGAGAKPTLTATISKQMQVRDPTP